MLIKKLNLYQFKILNKTRVSLDIIRHIITTGKSSVVFLYSKKLSMISNVLNYMILGNKVSSIVFAVLLFFVLFLGLKYLVSFLNKKIEKIEKGKQKTLWIDFLDLIKDTHTYFFIVIEVYIPLQLLNLPNIIDQILNTIFAFVVVLQIIRIADHLLVELLRTVFKKQIEIDKTSQNAIQLAVKVIVRVIGILLLLVNLGIEISPLVASLGIGGIAIAFSLQKILGDLFASFSILTSKPFKVGDWIVVGEKSGAVMDITLKATHLRSISGENVIIPNSQVLAGDIDNYGDMTYRRKRFTIGVTYQTSVKKLKKIREIIGDIIEAQEGIEFERIHLESLADFSITFKISYKLNNPDYTFFMRSHEEIILAILEAFEKEKIEIAYPTQVVYMPDMNKKK